MNGTDGWQRGRDHSRTEAKTIEFIKGLKPAVREFTGQSLLLNNSLPNFYFHCTTAYDILRRVRPGGAP